MANSSSSNNSRSRAPSAASLKGSSTGLTGLSSMQDPSRPLRCTAAGMPAVSRGWQAVPVCKVPQGARPRCTGSLAGTQAAAAAATSSSSSPGSQQPASADSVLGYRPPLGQRAHLPVVSSDAQQPLGHGTQQRLPWLQDDWSCGIPSSPHVDFGTTAADLFIDLYYKHFHGFHPSSCRGDQLQRRYEDPTKGASLRPLVMVMRYIGSLYGRSKQTTDLKNQAAASISELAATAGVECVPGSGTPVVLHRRVLGRR